MNISIGKNITHKSQLSREQVLALQAKVIDSRVLILDEISLISLEQLNEIDQLSQAMKIMISLLVGCMYY